MVRVLELHRNEAQQKADSLCELLSVVENEHLSREQALDLLDKNLPSEQNEVPALARLREDYINALDEGAGALAAMLRTEHYSKQAAFARARYRVKYDPPYLQAEVAKLGVTIKKLTSDDPDDIFCRFKGFMFSHRINKPDGPLKSAIFKYDALFDACIGLQ